VRDPETGEVRDSVRVTKSWDATARKPVPPKSKAGAREVELVSPLRAMLAAYLLNDGRRQGPLFGTAERRLDPRGIVRRAATAWKRENESRAEAGLESLTPVGLHELRHGFGSALIAGGVSATDAAEAMGHADGGALLRARYSHPMADARRETARKLETFLASRAG
jgi:integrase